MKLITFRVSDDQYLDIKKYCFDHGMSIRELFTCDLHNRLANFSLPEEIPQFDPYSGAPVK